VRSNLEALASAYAVRWQWARQTLRPVNSGESSQLSDKELDQLIQRIENAGDALRVSLTAAFDKTPYDQTTSESRMNDAVGRFKTATNQMRNHFDVRLLVVGDVERLIGQATPLERFMRNNTLTERAQSDWSALRAELSTLASAYSIDPFWGSNRSGSNAVTKCN
jgi:hypothetical protein